MSTTISAKQIVRVDVLRGHTEINQFMKASGFPERAIWQIFTLEYGTKEQLTIKRIREVMDKLLKEKKFNIFEYKNIRIS